ncbi:MAG: UDP-N-acetylglucosamine 2-epimerase (non-hydrolyzing) [Bacteroidales bacterium]|nr:UDP-N-acetylglucosamine 2-epimerase (non-hydrolyzing) [Bacteroidales bacterium]
MTKKLKLATIIGARPQFIKAAVLSNEISKRSNVEEIIIHTGQHFDENMSQIFFEQMEIPKPDYNLGINGTMHGAMTGQMLEQIEKILIDEKPDVVVVYGDTNSTLAGALAASKLHIPIAHVEAGLRSFNMKMPEEINRILTDRISKFLFCPSKTAVNNLKNEGFDNFDSEVLNVGDIMYDAVMYFGSKSRKPDLDIPDKFILATVHRQENTDNGSYLRSIFQAFNQISIDVPIVLPLHPRTKKAIDNYSIQISKNVHFIEPVGYLEMLYLLNNSELVMTDSGGLQKEAYFFEKPCVTLRFETEWTELVENGFNIVSTPNFDKILDSVKIIQSTHLDFSKKLYGDGNAAELILKTLIV